MIIGSDFLCVGFFFVGFIKSLMSLSEHVHIKITVKKKNKKKNVRSSTVCVQKEWNNVGALC